jgi:hypothetical protein
VESTSRHGLTPAQIGVMAADIAAFGLPLVTMDLFRRAHPGPLNRFVALPPEAETLMPGLGAREPDVVRRSLMLDLSKGAVVMSTPHTRGRLLMLTVHDGWGRVCADLGSRCHGYRDRDFLIVGPGWRGDVPAHVEAAVRAPSEQVWVLAEFMAQGRLDREFTERLADRLELYSWAPGGAVDPLPTAAAAEPLSSGPPHSLFEMPPAAFFDRVIVLMGRHPCRRQDGPLVDALARVGLCAGRSFAMSGWPESEIDAALAGVTQVLDAARADLAGAAGHGWARAPCALHRLEDPPVPLAAWRGLGAPLAEDMVRYETGVDAAGAPLAGLRSYRLALGRDGAPPAARWSLEASPLGRPLDPRRLVCSLDLPAGQPTEILVQDDEPPAAGGRVWLRPPHDGFRLTLRLFQPDRSAIADRWCAPLVERRDAMAEHGWRAQRRLALADVTQHFRGAAL